MIQAQTVRNEIHDFLTKSGWKTTVTGANYTRPGHTLEFKMGTSYGEVAVHIRQEGEIIETLRILSDDQVMPAISRLNAEMNRVLVQHG